MAVRYPTNGRAPASGDRQRSRVGCRPATSGQDQSFGPLGSSLLQRGRFTAALTARTMLAEHMFCPHNGSPITIGNPEEFAMAKLKLTYFDFDGGRGEPARLSLHIGGNALESPPTSGAERPRLRLLYPYLQMSSPVL